MTTTQNSSNYKAYLRVLVMGFCAFIFNTTEFVPIGLLTDISQGFNITTEKAGWMISIYAWIVAIFSLPLMLATRKIERKSLLLVLFAIFTISHLLSVIAWNFPVLVISRVGIACSHAIFWSIAAAITIRVAPKGKKTFALSVLATATSLAMILGVPIGRLIGQWMGWRMTFTGIAIIAFCMIFILIRLLPRLPSVSSGSIKSLSSVFKNPALIGSYLFIFLIFTAHYTSYSYIEPFMQQIGLASPYFTTFLLLLFGGAGVFGSIIFSIWGERYHTHLLLISNLFLIICLLILAYVVRSHWQISITVFIWGITVMLIVVSMQVKVFNIDNNAFEAIMSMYSGIINLGIGTGALLGGKVITYLSIADIGYMGAIVASLAILTILSLLYKFPILK